MSIRVPVDRRKLGRELVKRVGRPVLSFIGFLLTFLPQPSVPTFVKTLFSLQRCPASPLRASCSPRPPLSLYCRITTPIKAFFSFCLHLVVLFIVNSKCGRTQHTLVNPVCVVTCRHFILTRQECGERVRFQALLRALGVQQGTRRVQPRPCLGGAPAAELGPSY